MGFSIENMVTVAVPIVVDAAIHTIKDAGARFVHNYDKRRDVGFTPWPSVKGSFKETTRYYHDAITGEPFIEDKAAIYFINGASNRINNRFR